MPITGWNCSFCNSIVPLDHYETSACGHKLHRDYAAAVLADRELQQQRGGVRVSNALSCPRKFAILNAEDVAVDPLAFLTPLRGTAWHQMMERNCPTAHSEVLVSGSIAGVAVSGSIDRVRILSDSSIILDDWKTGKDARAVFIRGGKSYGKQIAGSGAPVEYKVQLSLYAELYHQTFRVRPAAATIWWVFSSEMWAEPVELMSIEQCLAHQPYDCGYTVAELLKQSESKDWQQLPLVGESFKFGTKTACDYCEVRDVCFKQAKGAPF